MKHLPHQVHDAAMGLLDACSAGVNCAATGNVRVRGRNSHFPFVDCSTWFTKDVS